MCIRDRIGGYCEEGFPLYFANYEMIRLMGYESYEELNAAIKGQVINTIHPDDRERVGHDIDVYKRQYLLCTSFHDPQRCGDRRYELC